MGGGYLREVRQKTKILLTFFGTLPLLVYPPFGTKGLGDRLQISYQTGPILFCHLEGSGWMIFNFDQLPYEAMLDLHRRRKQQHVAAVHDARLRGMSSLCEGEKKELRGGF